MTLEPDGWWFCAPPTREVIGVRNGRTYYSCPHGTWGDLSEARRAHAIDAEEVPSAIEAPR